MTVRGLMRRDLLNLQPLPTAGPTSHIEARLGRSMVKLDANENPYGPSPLVRAALAACRPERYPDPTCAALRGSIAEYLSVDPGRIACSAGGDEMIDILLRLFLEPGDEAIVCTPSFVMYELAAICNGGLAVSVPRDARFDVDVEAVEVAITDRTKIIFLCSPNNPTGNGTARETVERLLEAGRIVVLDEAYAEFAGQTLVDLSESHSNLVVLRTMSKWAGLAGLRLGYGVVDPEVAEQLATIRSPFAVSAPAQAAGIASLQDRAYLLGNVRRIVEEREKLSARLQSLPCGRVYPSSTNFLFWTTEAVPASSLHASLWERGVLVRPFTDPVDALRISVGTSRESDILMDALQSAYAELAG